MRFAELANTFEGRLQDISAELGALSGDLKVRPPHCWTCRARLIVRRQTQLDILRVLDDRLARLTTSMNEIRAVELSCVDANVEENDHTVYTADDLEFEAAEVKMAVSKKLAFVENQVSAWLTSLGPSLTSCARSTDRVGRHDPPDAGSDRRV